MVSPFSLVCAPEWWVGMVSPPSIYFVRRIAVQGPRRRQQHAVVLGVWVSAALQWVVKGCFSVFFFHFGQ